MKFQLRRMVLVNAGTNQHAPSARITAIDPRGGAAVLGDNGVGKTTTLRILPLFFGHLPGQIVSVGQGQEPMVRFVLPTDASAIAFEYQRGSDSEEDLRLVVIRRRSEDPDVPFYRLYRCGFRKELFVSEGRFLTDEEAQRQAMDLGIRTTIKLGTSEYRSVILRTPANSKEKEKLRHYSLDWSFGPKSLDNLDRLVAAMVKKHINFADIVQVAVGLVQQDLGHGAERAKLTFKQGKGQIDRWLKNREACVDAFKLQPRVKELEENLRDHRGAEAQFRSRRADVAAVRDARLTEKSALSKAVQALVEAHAGLMQAQTQQRFELTRAAAEASSAAAAAKVSYEDEAGHAKYFEEQQAAHWELRVQELPNLRLKKRALQEQVVAAETVHADATFHYERLANEAKSAKSEQSLAMEQGKQPHRDRLAKTQKQIGAAEDLANKEAARLQAAKRLELERTLEPLVEQRGQWETRKASPAASEAALNGAEQAAGQLQAHTEQRGRQAEVLSDAKAAELEAKQGFDAHEQAIRMAKEGLAQAIRAVEAACLVLAPNPGSLRAALRQHPDETWKRNLGKVISQELLDREDLSPAFVEDASETAYGWQLATGVIAAPQWTDDALARGELEAAEARQVNAQAHLNNLQDGLAGKSRLLKDAQHATGVAQAALSVLDGQTETLKTQLERARHQVETDKQDAAAKAATELARVKGEIESVRRQQGQLQRELEDQLQAVKTAHENQRQAAQKLHDDALADIDRGMAKLDEQLKARLESLTAQLNEQLSEKGVDVKRLDALKAEATQAAQDVLAREEKEPMVRRWRDWVAAGGTARLESLRAAALLAQEASGTRALELAEFEAAVAKAAAAHEATLALKSKRLGTIEDELAVLAELEEKFGDYMAAGVSVLDPATTARELQGLVNTDRAALTKVEEAINRRASFIRTALTAKDNAVRELVEVSLQRVTDGSDIARASELTSCYKLIGPQIATDVNNTLRAVLTNIHAFQQSISSFEKEVSAFNRRLQDGLSEVRCFERIKDLRLDIVTNFENMGFYKKLSRMDDIVRQHNTVSGKDPARELPPDETARALGDFMSVLGTDGNVEVSLSSHITLRGSVTDNGQRKEFKKASELENISSEGLTSLVLITLMTALLNTIRRAEPVHVPWVTDEVGKFDPKNFHALMTMLQENRIDVVTASPELGPAQQALFARHYLFEDRGRIRECRPRTVAQTSQLADAKPQAIAPEVAA